ncbi:B12-binding domain-containing radical SAM protein [archaeon]|nr:B12-binding domain-containing radical SAM protein [archaeon]MBL7057683.1 B12-binding domain-containing radical SAM protein [Candidatus Woesearchaeota archaeon]
MKIQLIRSPLDDWYSVGQIEEFVSIPIGLLIMAAELKKVGAEVSIIDGANDSLKNILKKINADWVGVMDLYSTHQNSLAILKYAKEQGAKTIIGGPNVNAIARRIIANNPFIDYAAIGDGENSFPRLIREEEHKDVPNIVSKKNPFPRRENAKLATIFDLEDMEIIPSNIKYFTVPISTIRGCIKAELNKRCSFCSIDHDLKVMNSETVWKQIRLLNEKYGVKSFLETGDTFIVGNNAKRLLDTRPKDLKHIEFSRVYAIPDQITPETAYILQQLNVRFVYLGIESSNDGILRRANKSYTKQDVEKSLNLLEERGIQFHVPFMYGLSGETKETMQQTYEYARELIEKHPNIKVCTSFAIPLPGSELFNQLLQNQGAVKEYKGNILTDDLFNYQSLVRLHLKYYTSVDFEGVSEFLDKTRCLIKKNENVTSFDVN